MHKMTAWDEVDEAELRTTKRILLRQGRRKFGDPAPKIEAALMAIKEFARLERMSDTIFDVGSWKELLAVK